MGPFSEQDIRRITGSLSDLGLGPFSEASAGIRFENTGDLCLIVKLNNSYVVSENIFLEHLGPLKEDDRSKFFVPNYERHCKYVPDGLVPVFSLVDVRFCRIRLEEWLKQHQDNFRTSLRTMQWMWESIQLNYLDPTLSHMAHVPRECIDACTRQFDWVVAAWKADMQHFWDLIYMEQLRLDSPECAGNTALSKLEWFKSNAVAHHQLHFLPGLTLAILENKFSQMPVTGVERWEVVATADAATRPFVAASSGSGSCGAFPKPLPPPTPSLPLPPPPILNAAMGNAEDSKRRRRE